MIRLAIALTALAGGSAHALPDLSRDTATRTALPVLRAAAVAAPAPDGRYVVRLLLLHSARLAEREGGANGMYLEAQRLVSLANETYRGSGIPVTFVLAGNRLYTAVGDGVAFEDQQDVLRADPAIRTLRDALGADVVLFLRTSDGNTGTTGGVSSKFNNGEQTDPPASVDPEHDAFAVLPSFRCPECVEPSYESDRTFLHELGHMLGGGHNYDLGGIENSLPQIESYWKPYAHAALCLDAAGEPFFSIMWGRGNVGGVTGPDTPPRITYGNYFTNPRLAAIGITCGAEGIPGIEATQMDNARAISEALPYVAAYRPEPPALAAAWDDTTAAGAGAPGASLLMLGACALRRRVRRTRPLEGAPV